MLPHLGCTPKGAYGNTSFWGSGQGSGEGVLRRVLRRGACCGFCNKKGSEKGSQKGFWEGGFQKVSKTPSWRGRPLRRAPYHLPSQNVSINDSLWNVYSGRVQLNFQLPQWVRKGFALSVLLEEFQFAMGFAANCELVVAINFIQISSILVRQRRSPEEWGCVRLVLLWAATPHEFMQWGDASLPGEASLAVKTPH